MAAIRPANRGRLMDLAALSLLTALLPGALVFAAEAGVEVQRSLEAGEFGPSEARLTQLANAVA